MTRMESARIFIDNKFGEIPNTTVKEFKPEEIIHVIIQVEITNGKMRYFLSSPDGDPPAIKNDDTIREYAMEVARRPSRPRSAIISPLDISVVRQCWVVVQLGDSIVNWQFTKGELGCTTKAGASERNVSLVHAYPADPLGKVGDVVQRDDCRVLYFGVRQRGLKHNPTTANPDRDAFNFHVEFIDGAMRLQVIFDPDVKNDSDTNTIPPDGG